MALQRKDEMSLLRGLVKKTEVKEKMKLRQKEETILTNIRWKEVFKLFIENG